jgi:5,10-methylenetetrahydromethanopterin reductase
MVARGPQILELAGRMCQGVVIASMATPEAVRWGMGQVEVGLKKAGRDWSELQFGPMLYTSISDDAGRARYIVKRGIAAALQGSFPNYDFVHASGLEIPADLYKILEARTMDYASIMNAMPDEFSERLALAGTPEQCAAQIEKIVALGVNHINLAPLPVDETNVEGTLVPFAEQVIPRLKAAGISQ